MASNNIFSDLLQRAEKLSSEIGDGRPSSGTASAFPKIPRNLDEVFEQGEQLWKKVAAEEAAAATSLPAFGEGIPSVIEKETAVFAPEKPLEFTAKRPYETLRVAKGYPEGTGVVETNLESLLRRERENMLVSLVEETIERTAEAMERRQKAAVMANWEQRKKKVLTEASIPTLSDVTKTGVAYQQQQVPSALGRTLMNDVEMAFARQVSELTDKILQGGTRPKLIDSFVTTARTLKEGGCANLWEQVHCMLETPVQAGISLLEQRTSQRFKVALVDNALGYLEKEFVHHMEAIVYGHIEKARLGGVPGIYRLVHGYLNVKMPVPYYEHEDGLIENHPTWAVIYYCLRSGGIGAAAMACEVAGPQLADLAAVFREMQTKDQEQLSSEMKTRLNLAYRRHVRAKHDPYKRAVYIVVSLCDTTIEDPEISDTLQNWLWYRLRQVRLHEMSTSEQSSASASTTRRTPSQDTASLYVLQKQVLEDYGERHFTSGDTPYLFWDALWLTGQFEAAIDYLCRQSELLRCHGVHVALAAHQLGVLLTPDDVQAKLCAPQRGDSSIIRRLNLVRLVLMYVAKFQHSDTQDAVNYLYFLRSFQSPKGENMFCVSLSDLVMETGEFEMMLGSINADGSRKPGIVDKFSFDTERLIGHVARVCEEKGLNERAVVLYDLAMDHTKALGILNDMLAQVCSESAQPSSDRDWTTQVALEIARRYREFGCKADVDISTTFYLLMDLVTFFDLYHEKRYTEAIEVIQKLDLVPLDMDIVNQHARTFYRLSEPVRRVLPQILLALMSMLLSEYRRIKGSITFAATATSNVEATEALKRSAHSLVAYIGMIPYCMPGDTTARLVQMEVLMH